MKTKDIQPVGRIQMKKCAWKLQMWNKSLCKKSKFNSFSPVKKKKKVQVQKIYDKNIALK